MGSVPDPPMHEKMKVEDDRDSSRPSTWRTVGGEEAQWRSAEDEEEEGEAGAGLRRGEEEEEGDEELEQGEEVDEKLGGEVEKDVRVVKGARLAEPVTCAFTEPPCGLRGEGGAEMAAERCCAFLSPSFSSHSATPVELLQPRPRLSGIGFIVTRDSDCVLPHVEEGESDVPRGRQPAAAAVYDAHSSRVEGAVRCWRSAVPRRWFHLSRRCDTWGIGEAAAQLRVWDP